MATKTQVTKKNSQSDFVKRPRTKSVQKIKPTLKVKTIKSLTKSTGPKHYDRLIYIRGGLRERTQPVGCMSYRISHDSSGTTIYYGLSTHHPQDRFDRSIARKVAEGRKQAAMGPTSSAHDILVPFVKESHTSSFVQHYKNFSKNVCNEAMLVSGKYVSEETNPIRALHDLLESLRLENKIPNRIRRCMKNMSLRFWGASYLQEKKFQRPDKTSN